MILKTYEEKKEKENVLDIYSLRTAIFLESAQLLRFIYLLRSLSHQNSTKSELVSTHNKNGILELNTMA